MAKKKSKIQNGKVQNKHPSPKSNICKSNAKLILMITASAAALFIASIHFQRPSVEAAILTANSNNSRKEAFLKWIIDNGGTFHPIRQCDKNVNVTLETFPEFGGWGLALPIDLFQNDQCVAINSTEQCVQNPNDAPIINELQPLFTIPPSLIISIPQILQTYASSSSPHYISTFHPRLHSILLRLGGNGLSYQINTMGLVEQDVILALHLMAENCQHDFIDKFGMDSFYAPYLEVLPGLIPRLDTFGDEEYSVLNDGVLEELGRESRRILEEMYLGKGGGDTLKGVLLDMIGTKLKDSSKSNDFMTTATCTNFDSFHRFVALISSRAMVLRGEKRVVPLAEMINYAPQPHVSTTSIRSSFELFHTLHKDGSMTIRSDRNIMPIDNTNEDGSVIQLFEDYGPTDSSLFLEAHGFVPNENPHHCAIVPGMLMVTSIAPNGIDATNEQYTRRALQALMLSSPHEGLLQDVCVRRDLTMVEDGRVVGRSPASDAIAIVSLLSNGVNNVGVDLRERCIRAVDSGDQERIELCCARFAESRAIVESVLVNTASVIVHRGVSLSNTDSEYSQENDAEMNRLVSSMQDAQAEGRDRLALAFRFRIEERRLLASIAYSTKQSTEEQPTAEAETKSELEVKLNDFKSFIESLHLPVNKLEPRIVGAGMRVGAYATETIDTGDVYLSLPANATIDYNTAIQDAPSDLKQLLEKYDGKENDGFSVLLIYLIHERFIMKEQSKWWPYLNLLPTVEEVKSFHPLFYNQHDIDQYLAGSDVRRMILQYQHRTAEKQAALSLDLDANLVLGSECLRDTNIFRWASAIIDSRSIWWDGKRHLAPLLDLVNADSTGKPHETRSEMDDGEQVAVTRATRQVQVGDQLFENYAQPNYLLFNYHGFILEDNPNDCALLQGLYLHRNDPGARNAYLLRSTSPTFCINDVKSLEELANFLRVKYNLPNASSEEISDDVRPYLIQVLEQRISRLKDSANLMDGSMESTPYHINCMNHIVKNDLKYFEDALKLVVLA